MKKEWMEPVVEVQEFAANEYVAACGYHPCNKTHEAESDSGFISGFIDDQSTRDDEATPVVIWTENGTNVHCTTRLDINTWETAKS